LELEISKTFIRDMSTIDRALINLLAKRCELLGKTRADLTASDILNFMDQYYERTLQNAINFDCGSILGEKPVISESITKWLRHADSIYLSRTQCDKVAYLGPEFSYSHLAAIKAFGDAMPMIGLATIPSVFESISRNDSGIGIVPIENTTDGRIADTMSMLIRSDVKICGEVLLPIHHNLLSKSPKEQIVEVHSKPQAISQCRNWLGMHLPNAITVESNSTAAAAELASKVPGVAAIASMEAARHYELDAIDTDIEDNPNNVTRFAVLSNKFGLRSGKDKTTILFQGPHKPGSLADAMAIFKKLALNLTWIESFPLLGTSSEYLFFIETDGFFDDAPVADAIQVLSSMTLMIKVVGSYPKAISQKG
jgi:chorismate mutase/prephenate dehydratase